MRRWQVQLDEWCGRVILATFALLFGLGVGFGLWNYFVGEPRQARIKAEEKQAAREEDRLGRERKNKEEEAKTQAILTCYPGEQDHVGWDRLDPSMVPAHDRRAWQPQGVVGIIGSHSGRIWDGKTTAVCWSPDGHRLASGGSDGFVRLWDPVLLNPLLELAVPGDKVTGVCFSPDGRLLAACGHWHSPGWVRVWRIEEGQVGELATFEWPDSGVVAVAFSPDGKRLAASGGETSRFEVSKLLPMKEHGWVQLWDVGSDTIAPLWTFDQPTKCVWAMAFSPDSRTLAAGCDEGVIRQWRVEAEPLRAWTACKAFLGWSGITAGCLFALLLLSCLIWRSLRRGDRARDWGLRATIVGAVIAFGCWAGVAWWGLDLAVVRQQQSLRAAVGALAFSPDGRVLAAADQGGTISLWNVGEDNLEERSTWKDGPPVHALAFSPNGKSLISGHEANVRPKAWTMPPDAAPEKVGGIRVWSLERKPALNATLLGRYSSARSVAVSPDGKRLVAGCLEVRSNFNMFGQFLKDTSHGWDNGLIGHDRLRVWDLGGKEPVERTPDRDGHFVFPHFHGLSDRFLPLEISGQDGIQFWEVAEGRLWYWGSAPNTLDGLSQRFLFPGPDGGAVLRLEARRRDSRVDLGLSLIDLSADRPEVPHKQLWESEDKQPLEKARWAFAADGRLLVWTLEGAELHLWDMQQRPFREHAVLRGHGGRANAVSLSNGGRWAAAGTQEGAVYLWDLSGGNPQPRHQLAGLKAEVTWLDFLPDGRTLAAGSADSKVAVWAIDDGGARLLVSGKSPRELTPEDKRHVTYAGDHPPPRKARQGGGWQEWVDTFFRWSHRLHARVESGKVFVTREDPNGKKSTLREWTPPGLVRWFSFSPDGRHLLVSYADLTVEIIRLDDTASDQRLLVSCNTVLANDPHDVPALLLRARVYQRLKRWHLALTDATAAVRLDPRAAEGWWLRGQIHALRGHHAEAIADFSTLLSLQPTHAPALYQRGLSHAERGNFAAARRDLDAALRIEPALDPQRR